MSAICLRLENCTRRYSRLLLDQVQVPTVHVARQLSCVFIMVHLHRAIFL